MAFALQPLHWVWTCFVEFRLVFGSSRFNNNSRNDFQFRKSPWFSLRTQLKKTPTPLRAWTNSRHPGSPVVGWVGDYIDIWLPLVRRICNKKAIRIGASNAGLICLRWANAHCAGRILGQSLAHILLTTLKIVILKDNAHSYLKSLEMFLRK